MTYYEAKILNTQFKAQGQHSATQQDMRLPLYVTVLFSPLVPRKLVTVQRTFTVETREHLEAEIGGQLAELETKAELYLFLQQVTSDRDLPFSEFLTSEAKPTLANDTPTDQFVLDDSVETEHLPADTEPSPA